MYKACSRCGRIHDFNYTCNAGKVPRKYANTDENKLRSKRSWKNKRAFIRDTAFNLCEVCAYEGKFTPQDIEIHHIVKLKDNPNGLLDNYNLIALCIPHHKMADRGELSVDLLTEIARKREERDGEQ